VYRVTEEPVGYDEKSIEFKPLDKYSDYVKVRLTLKGDTGSPVRVELFEKGGTRTDLLITKISEAENFPADHFVFNPTAYPDIRIEDLRID
jgi:outer membrane lipoprotein-sorting protein